MRRWAAATSGVATALAGAALVGWALVADPRWAERHVLPNYCVAGPAGWAVARGGRWIAAALGVLAVAWLAPTVARRVARASFRVQGGTAAGVSLALAAALGVAELHLRSVQARLAAGEPPRGPGGRGAAMARADPALGWSYVPGRTTWVELGGRRVAYAIDADGNRAASDEGGADPRRPTLLFAGESIAFGYGLRHEETYPYLVGRALGLQAVNLAVVGYGNDQAHLRALDALARLERPLAIVTLFVPDQIRRNVERWRSRLAPGPGGTLVRVPPSAGPRIARLLDELPYHGDEALRATAAILRATADAARARGAFPLFVVTNYGGPCAHEPGEDAWVVRELFVRQGLPYVRVDLDDDDRLPGLLERHPGPSGAAKIAAAIEGALSGPLGPGARGSGDPGARAAVAPRGATAPQR